MNIYSDFPTLSDEQYKSLNSAYSADNSATLFTLFEEVEFCRNSFSTLLTNYNSSLTNSILKTIETLNNTKDSLKILYPKAVFTNKNISSNLFAIIEKLLDCCIILSQQSNTSSKPYYQKVLLKLSVSLLNSAKELMGKISLQEIKLFKHM